MKIETTLPGTSQQKDVRINRISEALIDEGFQIEVDFEATYGKGWEIMGIVTTSTDAQRIIERMVLDYEAEDREAASRA